MHDHGGTSKLIRFNDLRRVHEPYRDQFKQVLDEIIDSSEFILGRHVDLFEEQFAQFCGAKYAVGTSNGLDAICLALKVLELPRGSEVLVPANSFLASALAPIMCDLKVVLVDIGDDYLMDLDSARERVTDRTKVILPVHLYGRPLDRLSLTDFAEEHNLRIIEDCAQSFLGEASDGRRCGTFGDIGCFSLYPGKNLGALGDGGILTTNNSLLFERLKLARNYGSAEKYVHSTLGGNCRLDTLQAAFLSIKIRDAEVKLAERKRIANLYLANIRQRTKIVLPPADGPVASAWHLFVISVDDRASFMSHMRSHNIETLVHYPVPIHRHKCFKSYDFYNALDLPRSDLAANHIVSIPLYPELSEREIGMIIDAVNCY